jgi:RNA polymerase sigma-70 factor (ECF subfamily)
MESSRQARFESLLEPVHEAATRFCLRLCTTRPDAEDLYHDALLAAWHGLPGLKDEARFKPWVFRIIVNTFRNQARRQRWRQWLGWDGRAADDARAEPAEAVTVDPRGSLDARRWVKRALGALSADERSLVVLFELEQYTTAEIAQVWNLPEGTIRSRLSRARAKMRKAIESHLPAGKAAIVNRGEVEYGLQPNQTATE